MVEKVTSYLEKQTTFIRELPMVELKLVTTLRLLATGDSYASLQYSLRVDESTISRFLPQVCKAIIDIYKLEVLSQE